MQSDLLESIEVNPKHPPTHVIIWLHGLGADGHDFEGITGEFSFPESLSIRYLFPNAPVRRITVNGGAKMRGWYDIREMSVEESPDIESIIESSNQIRRLMEREILNGMPSERIILAGFSQGGVIALYSGLRYEKKIAGILALSTYIPDEDRLEKEIKQINSETPIMIAHGTLDPVVPFFLGERVYRKLTELNQKVSFHQYPMQHQISFDEIRDINRWITWCLSGL